MNVRRGFGFLVLAIWVGFWVVACNGQVAQQSSRVDCQVVQHHLGETCVSLDPQRVIAIDAELLEASLALGVEPVATADQRTVGSLWQFLDEQPQGLVSLGRARQPNLEKMLQLDPDLIMGVAISEDNYEMFSSIAPTVVFENTHHQWQQTFQNVGEILGERSEAEQVLAQYQARIKDFQSAMGDRLGQTEVSILRFYEVSENAEFRTKISFPGSVIEAVGLPRPPAQRHIGPKRFFEEVSLEQLERLDGDVIFVALDPGSEKSFARYQTNPLWQTLKAVKHNRVYLVDSSYWIFGNILSANLILDDLFKYLVQAETSVEIEALSKS